MQLQNTRLPLGALALFFALSCWPAISRASVGTPAVTPMQKTILDLKPDEADDQVQQSIDNALKKAIIRSRITRAQGGDIVAQAWLGELFFSQQAFTNQAEGFRWLMLAAQNGDAFSQLRLAQVYDGGHGVARSRDLALQWYDKAATQNDAEALAELCLTYVLGVDRPRDMAKAKILCPKAGEAGNGRAYYALGLASEQGWGSPVDLIEAQARYGMAAAQGNIDAMDRLGVLAESPDQARVLFRRAMGGGSLSAVEHLAQQCLADDDQAGGARLYRYAAMRGSVTANAWLASNPAILRDMPPAFNLHEAARTFAIVKLPAHDDVPAIEISFWDYFSQSGDYYPEQAIDEEVEGESHVVCHVSPDKKITDCLPVSEKPLGYGFNEAIMRFLDRDIEVRTDGDDSGQSLVNRDFEIIFKWKLE